MITEEIREANEKVEGRSQDKRKNNWKVTEEERGKTMWKIKMK